MNVKLYTLILSLTLIATPALQGAHNRGAFLLARNLWHNILPAVSTEVNRALKTPKTPSIALKSPYAYLAIGLGVSSLAEWGLFDTGIEEADEDEAVQEEEINEVEEEQKFISINNLSMSDIEGILEALVGATEENKIILAQKISRVIIRYKTPTLIKMLKVAEGRSHRTLVQALRNNITWYSLDDINQILKEDTSRHTHEVVATALKNNYSYFTSYTVAGFSLYSNNTWRKQYVEVLKNVKPAQQQYMLQPILDDIGNYDVLHLLRYIDKSLDHTVLTAFTQSNNPNLSFYERGMDLMYLLERTKAYDQTNIANVIIKSTDLQIYNSWHFSGFNKYCNEGAKKILASAITNEIASNPDKYSSKDDNLFDSGLLETTAKLCTPDQQEIIADTINTSRASRWRTQVAYNTASEKWQEITKFKN